MVNWNEKQMADFYSNKIARAIQNEAPYVSVGNNITIINIKEVICVEIKIEKEKKK